MKVEFIKKVFAPLTVTFETEKEFMLFLRMVGGTNGMSDCYGDQAMAYNQLSRAAEELGIEYENEILYPQIQVKVM